MKTTSAVWATSVVLTTLLLGTAEAAPAPYTARPKYYYPRHVKREVFNVTETVASTEAPVITDAASTGELTSRGFLDGLLGGLSKPPSSGPPAQSPPSTGGFLGPILDPVVQPIVEPEPTPAESITPPPEDSSQGSSEAPTQGSSETPSQGGLLNPILAPILTPTPSESEAAPSNGENSSSAPSQGLLDPVLAPILDPTPAPSTAPPSEAPSESPAETPAETPADSPVDTPAPSDSAPTSQGLLDPVLGPILAPSPTPSEAPVDTPVETPVDVPAPSEPAPTSQGLLDPVLGPILEPTPTPSEAPPANPAPSDVGSTGQLPETILTPTEAAPVPTPSPSQGLLDPVLDPILDPSTGLLPETILSPTAPAEPTPTELATGAPTGDITVGLSTAISESPVETPLLPILTELLPTPTSLGGETGPTTGSDPTATGLLPEVSSLLSSLLELSTAASSGIPEASSAISSIASSVETLLPPGTSLTDLTSGLSSFATTGVEATATASSEATASATPTGIESGAESSVASSVETGATASTPVATETAETTGVQSTPIPTTKPATTSQLPTPTAIENTPTATNSLTSELIASSIFVEPTSAETASATVTPSGIPSELPKVIQPPGGMPKVPDNSTLCQIGFQYALNYPFVVRTPESPVQIFSFLKQGLVDGLNLPSDQVVMNAIRPYDTTGTLGFVTTMVMFYIPSDMFDKLNIDLHTPRAAIYDNENGSVDTIMDLINPAIPLAAGDLPDASGGSNGGFGVNPDSNGKPNDGGPMEGGSGSKSPVVASSVGIAFAAIGGVAAYGAAMFFVARRYKQKRAQRHARSSSVSSSQRGDSALSGYNGVTPAWMTGANNGPLSPTLGMDGRVSQNSHSSNERSVRTAQISAPVATENSLGWN